MSRNRTFQSNAGDRAVSATTLIDDCRQVLAPHPVKRIARELEVSLPAARNFVYRGVPKDRWPEVEAAIREEIRRTRERCDRTEKWLQSLRHGEER